MTTLILFLKHTQPITKHQMLINSFKTTLLFLKVGPALTFAMREALYSLCEIENEMFPAEQCSH